MQVQTMQFKARAGEKLADQRLQQNLTKLSTKFVSARATAITAIDFAATRAALKERRNRALENLDVWLETFEREATRRGVTVLFAETTREAAQLVADIARRHDVRKVIKTKSMVTEEMRLNEVLGQMGVQSIETDLGEYILQINDNEAPSHIIAPVVHKDKDEIADLFAKTHQRPRLTEITDMTREAREVLRPHFMTADMGVTGGNFLVAQTGSVALVTNEGNEGMCTVMPRVHVAVTGIEKVLPTLEDLATAMRLLPRSATGQSTSNYFSVLTPSYVGIDNALDLPQAATLCGECDSVCPVGIPLSGLLRKLREKQVERHLRPWRERAGLAVWGFLALHPDAYALFTKLAVRVLEMVGGRRRAISRLPLAAGWTNTRDMPAPVGRTFRELYAAQRSHLG